MLWAAKIYNDVFAHGAFTARGRTLFLQVKLVLFLDLVKSH